jgi:serine/threonine protein kinase
MLMGTMQYIAPEQINGLNIDHRTDIYSFGVVLYEMVTGGKAFPEANLIRLLNNINRNCYEPIRSLRPQTPKVLCTLIEQCMQLDRSDRIQNVSELLHRLEAIHKNLITRSDPVTVVKNYLKKDAADFDNSLLPSARRRMMYYGSVILPVLACAIGLLIRLPDNHSSLPIQSANSVQPSPATVPVRQLSTQPPENIRGEQEQTIEQPPSASEVSKSPAARSGTSSIASAKNGNKRPDKEATPHRVRAARQDSKTENRAITPDTNAPHPVSDNTSDRTTDKGYLLQLREATQNNALDELERLLSRRELDDGEYYLYKARYKIIRGELSKIEPLIQKAQTAPCRVMEPEKRDIEVLYTRARYLSLVFDHEQNKTNSVAAMEAWYTVKYQFRNTPSHAYFIKADMEIRRISDTIQNM